MGKAELRIEIDEALLARARAAGVEIQALIETALRAALPEAGTGIAAARARQKGDSAAADARAEQWARDDAQAIDDYNARIERRGVWGADLRRW
jgi:antitoxin CcdA